MASEPSVPARRINVLRALRQAALAGLIGFGLFLPLIGFNTVQNIHNELVLETRWPLLAIFVAVIAAGRFAHVLWLQWSEMHLLPSPEHAPLAVRLPRWIIPSVLGFAILYPALALALTGFQGAVKWIDNFG